jgi:ribosomal protein L28
MRKLGTKMPKSGNATIDEEKKTRRWWKMVAVSERCIPTGH